MPITFTPDQIAQLQELGITISESQLNMSETSTSTSEEIKVTQSSSPTIDQIPNQTISSNHTRLLLKPSVSPIVPLLSISGLTLISFGSLILFKTKTTASTTPDVSGQSTSQVDNVPTQVPKSIQHYLLTSQQLFTQALQLQQNSVGTDPSVRSSSDSSQIPNLLNQSILAATQAIKEFPNDYRGYDQRGRIYQSLTDSNPALLTNAISDLSLASKLNPESADITHTLANLFAKKGDVVNTLAYLNLTVSLDPTKAQNFYDLARLQTQAGYISQALTTYDSLLTIVTDPAQKQQVIAEKTSLEKLLSQSPNSTNQSPATLVSPKLPTGSAGGDGPLLQANADQSGPIIAAPAASQDISVSNLTATNSLAGTGVLTTNTSSVTLHNSQLTPTSQVYLTITKGGKNQFLQVLSKSGDSFTVGLDSPISEDIEFKWWIVNP